MIRLLVSTPLNQRVVKAPPADSATVSTTAKSRAMRVSSKRLTLNEHAQQT
jgi:hypothetical protein